jgi:uncharacterized protein
MIPPPTATRTLRQRALFVLKPVLIVTLLLLFVFPFALGVIFIRALTTGGCGGDGDPAAFNLPFEDITFPSSEFGTPIRGFFIPGDNGVTIIVPPAFTSGRGSWLHEIAVLHEHGYSTLSYESRSCMGQYVSLGYAEVTEVGDALDYLATRPDVDMEMVGIHGFSSAGATSIMAGARYSALRAILAEGGYHDFGEQLHDNVEAQWPGLGSLYEFGVHLGYRLTTGYDISVLSPVSAIDEIAPRSILLIYGTAEPSLPGAHLQLSAAGPNAQLWEVPGATHGSYWYTAPEEFEQRVIAFYDNAFDIRR